MNPISTPSAIPSPRDLASLLPDTSGLKPLSLPEEWLSLRSQTPLPPDAIRRFQDAISASLPPSAPAKPEAPAPELPPSPLHAVPFTAPVAPETPAAVPPPPSAPDFSSLRVSAPPSDPAALPVLPPPADLAKKADQLAKVLFSRLESIPPETLERREIRIPLAPAILDSASVALAAKDGVLLVTLTPSTPAAAAVADAFLPRLTEILPARIPSFAQVEVVLAPAAASPASNAAPALPPPPRVAVSPRGIPSSAVLPPPADLAERAASLAGILFSRLETIPPATLEYREIRIPLEPVLLEASSVVVTAKEGVLRVTLVPSKPDVVPLASALLPRVVEVLEPRLPAYPRSQAALAPAESAIPDAPRIAALPAEDDESAAQSPEKTPQPLQALPVSAPAPLEMPLAASDSRPQTARPAAPVQPVAPAPAFAAAPMPPRTMEVPRETDAFPRVAESPRQSDANPAQTPQTPHAPLQAVPFSASAPLDATPLSPASPPPSGQFLPSAPPAMPAEAPSVPAETVPLPGQQLPPPSSLPPSESPRAFPSPSLPSPASLPSAGTPSAVPSPSLPPPLRPAAPQRTHSASPLQAAPLDVPAPAAAPVPLADPSSVASAASARTANLAETANQIASAVAARILVTPSLASGGDGQIRIALQPGVLDGSTVTLTASNGTLAVSVVPATPEAAALAAAALPHLETALAAHTPSFRRVQVSLASQKGTSDEAD